MSDDSETAQDQGLVNRIREFNEMQKVGPTYDAPGSGGRNALAALQGRIRNFGQLRLAGASRLARQLADEFAIQLERVEFGRGLHRGIYRSAAVTS